MNNVCFIAILNVFSLKKVADIVLNSTHSSVLWTIVSKVKERSDRSSSQFKFSVTFSGGEFINDPIIL